MHLHLHRTVVVAVVVALLLLQCICIDSLKRVDPQIYQRCRAGIRSKVDTTQPRTTQEWFANSTCDFCNNNKRYLPPVENIPIEERFHVVIQLTTLKLEHELLSLTAALLQEQAYVSLFFMGFDRANTTYRNHDDGGSGTSQQQQYMQYMFQKLLTEVPCMDHAAVESRLAMRSIPTPPSVKEFCSETVHSTNAHNIEALQSCMVLMATSQYRVYQELWVDPNNNNLQLEYPISVIVTDIWGHGALYLAEEWGIPSIVLTDQSTWAHATLMTSNEPSLWLPSQIWRSLTSTVSFAGLNQLRKALNLKRKRHRTEFWNAVTCILVMGHHHHQQEDPAEVQLPTTPHPPLLHMQSPIFPPCVECTETTNSRNGRALVSSSSGNGVVVVTILVLLTNTMSGSNARRLLRGLSMARKSLVQCPEGTTTNYCWHDRIDIRVKWLLHPHSIFQELYLTPNPLPDFVEIVDVALFRDNLLNNTNNATLVLAHCQEDARSAILLQVTTLCLPTMGEHQQRGHDGNDSNQKVRFLTDYQEEEIARQVIGLVLLSSNSSTKTRTTTPQQEANNNNNYSTRLDGLQRALSAIRTAGSLRPMGLVQKSDPMVPRGLQQIFVKVMGRREALVLPHPTKEAPFLFQVLGWIASVVMALFVTYSGIIKWFGGSSNLRVLPRSARRHLDHNPIWEVLLARVSEVDTALEALVMRWKEADRGDRRTGASMANGAHASNGRHNNSCGTRANQNSSSKKRMGKHR